MATRHTQLKSRDGDREISATNTVTDAPIVPIEQLERMHAFRPDLVDWYIQETSFEAQKRREGRDRVNLYVFIERVLGLIFGLLVAVLGIGGGIYLGLHGRDVAASIIGGGSLATIVSAFIYGRNKS